MEAPLYLPRYRALTFDCYGTLIDWERGLLAQLGAWRHRRGVAASDGALLAAFAGAEHRLQELHPAAPYREILRRVQEAIAAELGASWAPEDGEALAASVGDWPPFADSATALRSLAGGYRLFVLSNVDRRSFARTQERLGVTFDGVVTAEDVGAYKPSPRFFDAARERLREMGVASEEVVHVAQSLYHDHLPAQRLGWPTVWVDRRAGQEGWGATPPPPVAVTPDLTVASLAELVEVDLAQRRGGAGGYDPGR